MSTIINKNRIPLQELKDSQAASTPEYSERFTDDTFEYRYVVLPRDRLPELRSKPDPLLSEEEWRGMGIQQSRGWAHYGFHK